MLTILKRERLHRKLQRAADHKLTLLCAPPGYGKTTLAWQFYLEARPHSLWHTVKNSDFATFYYDFIGVVRQQFPQLDATVGGLSSDPAESAAALTNALRLVVKEDLFLFLDDIHDLFHDKRFDTWLTAFINLLPVKCHLILISRVLPALPMAEMVARREVQAIGQQELRFTGDETDALAALMAEAETQPQPRPARDLVTHLEGWAAGLVLAFQPLPDDVSQQLLSSTVEPEALFDALAEPMLQAQPPDFQNFLLSSSVLAQLTPELVSGILGFSLTTAAQFIDEAARKNLFLTRGAGGLTYHGLFRTFLQRRFVELHPDRFTELHLHAGDWFVERRQVEEAFTHYMTAGAPDKASSAIHSAVQSYWEQGRVETLLYWNSALEQAGLHSDRMLYIAASIHIDRLEFETASDELDRVAAIASAEGNRVRLAEVGLHRVRIHLISGHFLAAVAEAERLLQLDVESDNLRGRTLRSLGFAYFRLGKLDDALRCLEEAVPLSRQHGDKLALSNLLQDLQVVYMRLGMLKQAAACLQEVVAIRRAMGSILLLSQALNDLGYHYHQHGDYAEAFAAFQEGLSVTARIQNRRIEGYLLWSMGDLQRDLGSFDEAKALYHQALSFAGTREPGLRANVLLSLSTLHRWQGQVENALSLAEEGLTLTRAHQLALEQSNAEFCYWAARMISDSPASSVEALNDLVDKFTAQRMNAEAAQALAVCAYGNIRLGNQPAALTQLNAAAQLLKRGGSMQGFSAEIVHTAKLDQFVITHLSKFEGIKERLNHLRTSQFRKANTIIELEESIGAEYAYTLRVLTLGKEKVERDGVPILPNDWRATAAREFFFYLMFQGSASRETMSLVFWPESSANRVRSNFHTTLYRVRQALGENVVIYQNETYTINPDVNVWCDAHEFERLVQHAQNLSIRDARTEELFRRAVDLYQGDFLPLLNAEWITHYRERLRDLYLECVLGLGYCAEARADHRQALNLYKQALVIDPFREDIHRAVMSCYAQKGERHKILQHLHKMQELFLKELAVEPTKETVAYARKLMNQ
ncbi:MAG: BTAD domain-containing putative transcriptional regulator [Anaerolineae bacterium]